MSKWHNVKLGDVSTVNPPKKHLLALYENKVVSFIPMSNVTEDGGIITNNEKSYSEVSSGFTYFLEDDVLFAKITPCMENGKGAIARGLINGLGVGSTEFHVLRPNTEFVTSDWIYRFVSFSRFRKLAEKNMTGSAGQKRVPKAFLENVSIPLPPLETQKQIAKTLDTAAELLAMRKQQLAELDNLVKSTFFDMFGDTESNSKNWDMFSFSSVVSEFKYGTSVKSSYERLGYPILRIPNVVEGTINLDDLQYNNTPDTEYQRIKLKKNDLLFVRSNGNQEYTGRSALVRKEHEGFIYASYLIRARIDNQKVNLNYIYLSELLKTDAMRKQMKSKSRTSAGQYNINTEGLGSLQIFLPPLLLQTQFAEIVTKIEEQKVLVNKAIDETQYLFDSLMSEYFE